MAVAPVAGVQVLDVVLRDALHDAPVETVRPAQQDPVKQCVDTFTQAVDSPYRLKRQQGVNGVPDPHAPVNRDDDPAVGGHRTVKPTRAPAPLDLPKAVLDLHGISPYPQRFGTTLGWPMVQASQGYLRPSCSCVRLVFCGMLQRNAAGMLAP